MLLSVTSKRASVAVPCPPAGLPLLGLLCRVDEVLLLHLLDDLVDQLVHLPPPRARRTSAATPRRTARPTPAPAAIASRRFSIVWSFSSLKLRVRVLKAGVQQKIRQRLHQVFQPNRRGQVARELGVADALHGLPLVEAAARAALGVVLALGIALANLLRVARVAFVVRDFFSPALKLRSSVRLSRLCAYMPSSRNSAALTAISGRSSR
jgi:hypothetical protein